VAALAIATLIDPRWVDNPDDLVFSSMAGGPSPMFYADMILFSLLPGTILAAGGVLMWKCRGYALVYLAGTIVDSPFTTLTWFLGLPLGIWTIRVLARPHVRAAFHLRMRGRASLTSYAPIRRQHPPTGPVRRQVRSFFDSLLAMFISRPGKGYQAEEDQPAERS
jgi:hypothetical protein